MHHDDGRAVIVLVSRHALENVDLRGTNGSSIDRFKEYRRQFEEIACAKLYRGTIESDGTVCIRARDLPGCGH
jgi:hypothetical protein